MVPWARKGQETMMYKFSRRSSIALWRSEVWLNAEERMMNHPRIKWLKKQSIIQSRSFPIPDYEIVMKGRILHLQI